MFSPPNLNLTLKGSQKLFSKAGALNQRKVENPPRRSKHCSHSWMPSSLFSITPARYALKWSLQVLGNNVWSHVGSILKDSLRNKPNGQRAQIAHGSRMGNGQGSFFEMAPTFGPYLEKYLNLKLGSVTSMIASSIFACFIAHSGYSFEPFILQRYFEITTESAKKPFSKFAQGIWCFGFMVSYHSERCSPSKESRNLSIKAYGP